MQNSMKNPTKLQRRQLYAKTGSHYTKPELAVLRQVFIGAFNKANQVVER